MVKRFWTPEEVEILRQFYPNTRTEDLAQVMGVKASRLFSKADQLGLRKSKAYMKAEMERQAERLQIMNGGTRFQPGHKTWNKGTKGIQTGGVETQFKKGNLPHNHKPIGHERINVDGYLERKVADELGPLKRFNFRAVHRILWEEAHGPIPKDHVVVFKNKDKLDVRLENLEMISLKEHAIRNGKARFPPEIRAVIQAKAVLTRRINRMEKERAEQNDAS